MLATKVFMMIATSLITLKKTGSIAGVGTNNIHLRNPRWFQHFCFVHLDHFWFCLDFVVPYHVWSKRYKQHLQRCQDAGDSACLMSLVSLDVICPVMALASCGIQQATWHGLLNLGFKWRCHKRRCLDLSFWADEWVATADVMHTTAIISGSPRISWVTRKVVQTYWHSNGCSGSLARALHILKLPVVETQTTKAPLGMRNDSKVTNLLFNTFGWIAVERTWWILDLKLANLSLPTFKKPGVWMAMPMAADVIALATTSSAYWAIFSLKSSSRHMCLSDQETCISMVQKKVQFPRSKYLPLNWLQCAAAIFVFMLKCVSLRKKAHLQPWLNRDKINRGSSDWWVKALMISPKASGTVKLQ